ncbi:hypothetical protein BDV95DRAFT_601147 [Massariosphaeria phaeospora]|uniref:Uncharacterized protein n=1 Tax=Massariosphaeria phaeospora TaxID=100035 RepID=A0A7C8IG23_9PLEO|nr:hypothetical protein BDV95DRAFT_601147 [Massariosphaeria phaeospora]
MFFHHTVHDSFKANWASKRFLPKFQDTYRSACEGLCLYMTVFGSEDVDREATLEAFMVFAGWARFERGDFGIVTEMMHAARKSFGTDEAFLTTAARYGFTDGIDQINDLDEASASIERHGVAMVASALLGDSSSYDKKVIAGAERAVDISAWLIDRAIGRCDQANTDRVLKMLLMKNRWHDALSTVLSQGADANKALKDPEVVLSLIGTTDASPVQLSWHYHSLLDTYADALTNNCGVNLNARHHDKTIWQQWLGHTCTDQLTHGLLEPIHVRAFTLFLRNGANPHEVITFQHERLEQLLDPTSTSGGRDTKRRLAVPDIVDRFFGVESREKLLRVLRDAGPRWAQAQRELRARGARGAVM